MEQRKRLKIFISVIVIAGIISFAIYNSRQFFEGPQVTLFSPDNGTTFDKPIIRLQGKARNTAFIKLNGHPVYVDEKNEFDEKLLLPPGTSIMKLEATDRFERNVEHTLWYTYAGQLPSYQITAEPPETNSEESLENN